MLINNEERLIQRKSMKNQIIGASMIEYILGLMILVIALTVVPIPNSKDSSTPNSKDLSAVKLFELALKKEYAAYSKSIAEPR